MNQMFGNLFTMVLVLGLCLSPKSGHADVSNASDALLSNGAQQISLGESVKHENLTLYPLLTSNMTRENPYTPLDKAMDKGKLRVKELSSASVPSLSVKNTGKEKVFVMTGEIVTGAKQDRMSAHDVLLPPTKQPVKLSVYCVEQGRWHHNSAQFAAGKTAGTTILRKTAAKKGGQGAIWSKVAKKSRDASVNSSTGTMQAVYNNRRLKQRIAGFERALKSMGRNDAVVGFVAAVDGNIVSADLFDNHSLMQSLYGKLLKAISIDAVTSKSPNTGAPAEADVRAFVKTGFNGKRKETDNPGLGAEYLIEAENGIDGTMLVHDGRIVHLSVFGPEREDRPRALGRPEGPNRRRGNRSAASRTAPSSKNSWSSDDSSKRRSAEKQRVIQSEAAEPTQKSSIPMKKARAPKMKKSRRVSDFGEKK